MGPTGAPKYAAGFGVGLSGDGRSLTVGAGRYYVDGVLCENDAALDYTQQPFLVAPQPAIDAMLSDLRSGRSQAIQIWLEAWQRLVTALDDPCIREVALGEADTTARVQTVWRVVAQPIAATLNTPVLVLNLQSLNQALLAHRAVTGDQTFKALEDQSLQAVTDLASGSTTASVAQVADSLRVLQVSTATTLRAAPATSKAQPQAAAIASAVNELGTALSALPAVDCCVSMRAPPPIVVPGTLSARTSSVTGRGSCLPSPHAGFRGLENQLYRVEIHQGGTAAQATFKWSRDNGSVLTGVSDVSGATLTLDSLGPDANLGFQPEQWVELADDGDEFGVPPNRPGDLLQIKSVDPAHLSATLHQAAPKVNTASGHAKLRRWDQAGGGATTKGIPLSAGTWLDLENGIQIQFSGTGTYNSGDHWLIPARTATGDIEWPPCGSDGAVAQPPQTTTVHRSGIACIHLDTTSRQLRIDDCRALFAPLTDLTPIAVPPAFHVTKISWSNDDVVTLDQLLFGTLTVTLDKPVGQVVNASNFLVTIEMPFTQTEVAQFSPGTLGLDRYPLIIDGSVVVKGNALFWSMPSNTLLQTYAASLAAIPLVGARLFMRARVKLMGHTIFGPLGQATGYLDGQCFGVTGTRADNITPRVDLQLPSGNSDKASDFESWFYVAPLVQFATFAITPNAVALFTDPTTGKIKVTDASQPNAPPTVNSQGIGLQGAVTLNYPVINDMTVTLTADGANVGELTFPASLLIKAGTTTATFAVTINTNPGATTQNVTFTAALNTSTTYRPVQTAPLKITGFAPVIHTGPVIFQPGVLTDTTVRPIGDMAPPASDLSPPSADAAEEPQPPAKPPRRSRKPKT